MVMKYDCEVIRDLLPTYKDGVSNKKINEVIEEHLKECEECNKYYDIINKSEITLQEPTVIENPSIVDYGKRIKKRRKVVFITVVSIIAVLLLGMISMAIFIVTGGPPIKTSDIKDYGVFEDFKGYSNLYIFPIRMPESARIDSYFYYQQDTLFDPTCQIYLEYSLSEAAYEAEVSRLSKISERYEHEQYKNIAHNIVYDTEHFKYPAYVTIFDNDHCYEYALLNKEEHKIICVFTQFIEPSSVKFDRKYLPTGFGEEKSSGGFNIYYSGKGMGYFERRKR